MKPELLWPVDGEHPITFEFGEAPGWYVKQFGYPHNGIDVACPIGTPIRACDDGRVFYSDNVPDKDGMGILLAHTWGLSNYWHLSNLIARSGNFCKQGDIIGLSGNTGFVTGPHLHFGVKVDGVVIPGMNGWSDPRAYLTSQPVESPTPEPIGRTYIVKWGDSLWKIAQKFYGNGALWRKIYNANTDKISDPSLIRPLQILLIP